MRSRTLLWLAVLLAAVLLGGAAWAAYGVTLDPAVVNADRPPYATVEAAGKVTFDGQPVAAVPVALRLDGPAGQLLAADQVSTGQGGRFEALLPLPVGTPSGTATLVAAAAGVVAQQQVDIPPLPAAYYGSVKDTAGQPVASGKVEAYIGGRKAGEIQFTNGFYGGAGGLDPKLVVSGSEADRGKPVGFRVVVGGQALEATASPAVTWQPGDVRRADLTVAAAPPPQDTTPPTVVGTDPADGGTNVPVDKTITVTFSENVQPGTTYDAIAVKDAAGMPVSVDKSISGAVLSLKPSQNLAYDTRYTVTVPAGAVKDLAGNALAQACTFSFATRSAPPPVDTAPPTVVGTDPANGATGVALDATITVTFSEDVQQAAQFGQIVMKDSAGNRVDSDVSLSGKQLTIKPKASLAYGTAYTVVIPAGAVQDAAGNVLAQDYTFTFTTRFAPTGGGGGGGGAPAPAPAPPKEEGAVAPGTGGTVSVPAVAKVEVPPAAVETPVKVTVEKLAPAQADPIVPAAMKDKLASDVVDIRVDVKVTFKSPIRITVHYSAAKVPSGMKPALYYYHEGRAKWLYLGGTVDPAAGTVTVEITHLTKFAVFAAPVVTFKDTAGHWAERQNVLDRLVGLGVIAGYPDGTFRPDNNVTRAEFAKMLVVALDLAPDAAAAAGFADAADIPAWAKGYVGAAVKAGLIRGYEDKTFRADRQITRAELAVMVARALKATEKAQLGFKDAADIPSWAAEGITQAVAKGIIKGYEDNTFRPANPATRAETAAMALRLLSALGV